MRWELSEGDERGADLDLGSIAVEESVAAIVDAHVAAGLSRPWDPLPVFPYRVVELVVDHYAKSAQPPFVHAVLGTFALLSTHPGPTLCLLARTYAEERSHGRSQEEVIETLTASSQMGMRRVSDLIVTSELSDIERVNSERGHVEDGIRHYTSAVRKGIAERLTNPLF